jgi:hypothetical protein
MVGFVARSFWSLFFGISDKLSRTQGLWVRTLRRTKGKNGGPTSAPDNSNFLRFLKFFMSPDSLVYRVLALRGILALGFFSLQFFSTRVLFAFYSFFSLQFFEFCMDIWKLNGHVAALVSHQGDAATASRDIPTSVTFSL